MAVKKVRSKKSEKVEHREIGENAAREREKNLGKSGWNNDKVEWNHAGGRRKFEDGTVHGKKAKKRNYGRREKDRKRREMERNA